VFPIIGALIPVFALIALGIVLGRLGLLGAGADEVLSRFVGLVTLPVLTFLAISGLRAEQLAQPVMATVVIAGAWLTFALQLSVERLCGRPGPEANVLALSAAFGNSGFVGLPICLAILGKAALGPAALVMALTTGFVFAPFILLQELTGSLGHSRSESIRTVSRALVGNPLILSCIAGIAAALGGVSLPAPVQVLLSSIAAATAPCALVAIGMFVARPMEQASDPGIWRGWGAKLALSPLMAAALLAVLPPLDRVWTATALIMAAMPTASSVFVIVAGDTARRISASIIVRTTVGSVVTIPIVLAALAYAGVLDLGPAPLH
jgi:predicted permease